jgi:hypothetical protein
MFASAGREASDFNELAQHLAGAGYSVTLFEAPAINGTQASVQAPSLFDLADDAAIYLETRGTRRSLCWAMPLATASPGPSPRGTRTRCAVSSCSPPAG